MTIVIAGVAVAHDDDVIVVGAAVFVDLVRMTLALSAVPIFIVDNGVAMAPADNDVVIIVVVCNVVVA